MCQLIKSSFPRFKITWPTFTHSVSMVRFNFQSQLRQLSSPRFGPAIRDLPSDLSFFKDFLHLNMSLPCLMSSKFLWSIQTLSANFLSKLGGFCWDCLVKRYELNGNQVNWFNAVTCSLSSYYMYYSTHSVILCLPL